VIYVQNNLKNNPELPYKSTLGGGCLIKHDHYFISEGAVEIDTIKKVK